MKSWIFVFLPIMSCATSSQAPPSKPAVRSHSINADTKVIVRGRIIDADTGDPVSQARVDIPDLAAPVAVNASGKFELGMRRSEGCIRLRIRGVGYGWTERTLDVTSGRTIEVGDIPLRPAPVAEWPTLLIMSCSPSAPGYAPWGADTLRV